MKYYCFSTETVVTRTRFNITFTLTLHVFLRFTVTRNAYVLTVCTVGAEPRVFWALKCIFGLGQ